MKSILLGARKCTLACVSGNKGSFFGNVKDGTRCTQDPHNYDVCIDGKCQVSTTLFDKVILGTFFKFAIKLERSGQVVVNRRGLYKSLVNECCNHF